MSKSTELFLKGFKKVLSGELISEKPEDLSVYGQDWSGVLTPAPLAIAFPKTTEDVSKILKLCLKHKIAVVPSGGRTGLSGGAVATNGEVVLSLSKMNKMGALDAATRTIRVQAGAITEAVHKQCEPHGLTWPVDFASKGSSQIGGNLATNAGGVRVIRYGPTRNWVLSLELVTMEGEVLELNGDLEKNNTGYDLRQLVIGSEGTLGVITQATLKLAPLPKNVQTFLFSVESMEKVIDLFEETQSGPFTLSAFEYLSSACYEHSLKHFSLKPPVASGASAYALVEVEASADSDAELQSWLESVFEKSLVLDGVLAQSSREMQDLWKIREGIAESVMHGHQVHQHDVSVSIRDLPQFAREIEGKYEQDYPEFQVFIFGHIGDGNLHIFIQKPQEMDADEFVTRCKKSDRQLFEFIQKYKGSVSAEHGIGVLKKEALPYSRPFAEIAVLKAVKHAFDPSGLMNPGKII